MDGNKQPFFKQFRKIASTLDRSKNICQNPELNYQHQTTSFNLLKGYTEELKEKLVESNKIFSEQEVSLATFQYFLDLSKDVIAQQKEILESQELYMEQYGYVPYEKKYPEIKIKEETPEPSTDFPPLKENVSPEQTKSEENCENSELLLTPKLDYASLSHYTLLQLQKPKNSLDSTGPERIATPAIFQHNGLIMTPGMWGKIPSIYTPDVRNSAHSVVGWPESIKYSAKKSAFQFCSAKKIRKKLQMEINNSINDDENDNILNQCPQAPKLSELNQKNLNFDIYQLPPTPKSAKKMGNLKANNLTFGKPKDYMNEELPAPPKLNSKFESFTDLKDKPRTRVNATLSRCNMQDSPDIPSPPLLHTTLSNFEHTDIISRPVLSCKINKKNPDG